MWLDTLIAMKKKSGKTIEQIADESGVPRGTLNKIFAGQTRDPKYQTLLAIVHCLGFTVDDLEKENSSELELTSTEELVTRDQLIDALKILGFLGKDEKLSDTDLKFLRSVVALLDEWFKR